MTCSSPYPLPASLSSPHPLLCLSSLPFSLLFLLIAISPLFSSPFLPLSYPLFIHSLISSPHHLLCLLLFSSISSVLRFSPFTTPFSVLFHSLSISPSLLPLYFPFLSPPPPSNLIIYPFPFPLGPILLPPYTLYPLYIFLLSPHPLIRHILPSPSISLHYPSHSLYLILFPLTPYLPPPIPPFPLTPYTSSFFPLTP